MRRDGSAIGKASDVYARFMASPDPLVDPELRSSGFADHYKRGLAGVMRPQKGADGADQAWRAGRDRRGT